LDFLIENIANRWMNCFVSCSVSRISSFLNILGLFLGISALLHKIWNKNLMSKCCSQQALSKSLLVDLYTFLIFKLIWSHLTEINQLNNIFLLIKIQSRSHSDMYWTNTCGYPLIEVNVSKFSRKKSPTTIAIISSFVQSK